MKKNKGFTLIELIVVIAILGIIITIAVMNFPGVVRRFRVRADIASGKEIGKSLSVRNVDIERKDDEIPLFPKIIKYNEIGGVDKYVSNKLMPSSFVNGYYYASRFVSAFGESILVGIGGENTEKIEKVYDGDGPGWVYLEEYDLSRFVSDNKEAFKNNVEIIFGSNQNWREEEKSPTLPDGETETDGKLLASVCKVGSWVKYEPSVTKFESKKEDNGWGNQTFKPSSYSGGFRVIDVSGNTVTLISEESVGNLTLRGKVGYINATSALNKICSNYVNSLATFGRSIGSSGNSIVDEPAFLYDTYKTNDSIPSKWRDEAYLSDTKRINSGILNTGEEYWLASRNATTTPTESSFVVNFINSSGVVRGYTLYYIRSDGTIGEFDDTIGVRPIITLKSSVKVRGGDGSVTHPFEIGD